MTIYSLLYQNCGKKKKKCFVVGLKLDTNHVITRIFTPCNCKSKIEMESFLISTFE